MINKHLLFMMARFILSPILKPVWTVSGWCPFGRQSQDILGERRKMTSASSLPGVRLTLSVFSYRKPVNIFTYFNGVHIYFLLES